MTHDYGERMSLALDGRLSAQERAELEIHLAACGECRARWAAFQEVDHVLSSAPQVAPAPGFARRFSTRWARQQALQARRAKRERALAGAGVLAVGGIALALLVVPLVIVAWTSLGSLVTGTPALLANAVESVARWWVTLRALGEASQSLISVLAPSSGPIIAGYALMLAIVLAAWAWAMRGLSRRWDAKMLPMLIWF